MLSARLRHLVPALLVVPILLSGCTATQSESPSAPLPTPSSSDGIDVPGAEAPSPLDPYLDVLYNRISDEEYLQQFLADEQIIAACMTEAGFEYSPRGAAFVAADQAFQGSDTSSREWVEQNGYGINAWTPEKEAAVDAADPNASYVAELSAAESEAYYLSLWGDENDGGDFTGCYGETADGQQPLSLADRWQPLTEALQQMWGQLIPADPDAIAASEDWSDCMAAGGRPGWKTPSDAATSLSVAGDGPASGEVDSAALAAEVEVALADFDCRAETDYDARMRQVRIAAETTFLDQNRAELEILLAESEQGE
ncbi:hypothetical protein ACFXQA_14850 [Microbacterium sp. P07]|uniref:hypothetical protein n=1 Tax=Microbacterium sp. P07 TaxID=3366952 RepID=UPI003746DE11